LITYYDEKREELCFRRLEDIGDLGKGETTNMITRDVLNDVMTTQWTKRKLQIKEDY
jgi:hypothetical protein